MKEIQIDDAMLDSAGQQFVREAVKSLPEDSLSLSWRSALNEKVLREAAVRQKRSRIGWVLKPAFGLAFAGAFAALIIFNVGGPRPGKTSGASLAAAPPVEAALVQDYRQNTALTDVVGSGLNPLESAPTGKLASDTSWSPDDITSL